MTSYDVIVAGLGGFGSAAAAHLAARGPARARPGPVPAGARERRQPRRDPHRAAGLLRGHRLRAAAAARLRAVGRAGRGDGEPLLHREPAGLFLGAARQPRLRRQPRVGPAVGAGARGARPGRGDPALPGDAAARRDGSALRAGGRVRLAGARRPGASRRRCCDTVPSCATTSRSSRGPRPTTGCRCGRAAAPSRPAPGAGAGTVGGGAVGRPRAAAAGGAPGACTGSTRRAASTTSGRGASRSGSGTATTAPRPTACRPSAPLTAGSRRRCTTHRTGRPRTGPRPRWRRCSRPCCPGWATATCELSTAPTPSRPTSTSWSAAIPVTTTCWSPAASPGTASSSRLSWGRRSPSSSSTGRAPFVAGAVRPAAVRVRLFVALAPPAGRAGRCRGRTRAGSRVVQPDLRWIPVERWHLTLAFYGEVPDESLTRRHRDRCSGAVAAHAAGPIELSLLGERSVLAARVVGRGRRRRRPVARAGQVASPPTGRRYRAAPHGRPAARRPGRDPRGRGAVVVRRSAWRADEVHLVRSFLGPARRYETVSSWPVTGAGAGDS